MTTPHARHLAEMRATLPRQPVDVLPVVVSHLRDLLPCATRRHLLDFLHAIETNSRPVADIEEGHISSACCILANLSMQLGGVPLRYDPVRRRIVGNKKANALLRRRYRKGWVHPAGE